MVYFAQDQTTGLIKIGYTTGTVEDRIKALQTGCPGELLLLYMRPGATEACEREFHELFAPLRVRGEWFRPGKQLILWLMKASWRDGETDASEKWFKMGWDAAMQEMRGDRP